MHPQLVRSNARYRGPAESRKLNNTLLAAGADLTDLEVALANILTQLRELEAWREEGSGEPIPVHAPEETDREPLLPASALAGRLSILEQKLARRRDEV